jgi:outer membrane biosynthesis protein TonB
MRVRVILAASALLTASLTGCSLFHVHASQQEQAPPLQTGQGELEQEAKKNQQPPPPSTLPVPASQATPPPLPPEKERKVKHPKRTKPQPPPLTTVAQTQQPQTPETNHSNDPDRPVAPIGELTTGDSATQAKAKQDTLVLISTTQQGLSTIKRVLSKEEQITAEQIRTFLTQAKSALDGGDSDGALTLATKAKLLLDELVKQ